MGIADKTKYQVMMKMNGGEPLTSKRSWLNKNTAIEWLKSGLDSGHFEWGTLIKLDLNDSLIDCEEYYYEAV